MSTDESTPVSCVEQIGQTAGLVWRPLNDGGPQSLAKLVKAVDAPRDMVLQAVGWLAREDKVCIEEAKRGRIIGLHPRADSPWRRPARHTRGLGNAARVWTTGAAPREAPATGPRQRVTQQKRIQAREEVLRENQLFGQRGQLGVGDRRQVTAGIGRDEIGDDHQATAGPAQLDRLAEMPATHRLDQRQKVGMRFAEGQLDRFQQLRQQADGSDDVEGPVQRQIGLGGCRWRHCIDVGRTGRPDPKSSPTTGCSRPVTSTPACKRRRASAARFWAATPADNASPSRSTR